jgi:subtilisin family serine protease
MKFFLFACFLGVVSALQLSKVAEPLDNEYVIQFKSNISAADRLSHLDSVKLGSKVLFEYDFPGFAGYAAVMESDALSAVLDSPLVQVVEQNGVMRTSEEPVGPGVPQACNTQTGSTWGIVRTNKVNLDLDGQYTYLDNAGAGVMTYVIDTGIYCAHNDFGGRCQWGANFVDSADSDGNGHGTHVAGTMVGNTWGLAKSAGVKAVKVLSAGGSGSTAGVIAGINWVVTDAIAMAKKAGKMVAKAVGNMSLGGGLSTTMNNAVNAAVDAEVIMAVASGNSLANACNYSPASAANCICVSSSTNTDAMSSFSNWGNCVDIFGPGTSITSAWIGSPSATSTISGTSMASPHVAGVAAKLMQQYPSYDADKIKDEMISIASDNKLSNVRGSPNKLVYQACAGAADTL